MPVRDNRLFLSGPSITHNKEMPMASSKRSILGERETVNVAITQVSDEDIASPERNREVIDIFRMTVPVNLLGLPAAVVMAFRKSCKLLAHH